MMLPRPDLTALGITHRRIPLMAIGKDVYCDSAVAVDALQALSATLQSSPSDKAFEAYGNTIIGIMLRAFALDSFPGLVQDRATIFSVVTRPDHATLRESALSELKSIFEILEFEMLADRKFVAGDAMTIADINVVFVVRWALLDLQFEKVPGFGTADLPRVYAWISRIPLPEAVIKISAEEASAIILESEPGQLSLSNVDLHAIPIATGVVVETVDSVPGSHPQYGTLIGSARHKVVIEIENGLRLHFPKRGYIIRSEESFQKCGIS
ncbi:hypothetical protein PFICI_05747 [Pestalotiopsis fici W106-1]|uniref:GST C-terminal domain-containing protein n=1 Tax=Pestalotiopsis fici (strain W106-1 / CGMCC3.15140) TaxID=1229662 RepID=W3XF95_PESFW|nr:uncharacterized protein PFICI_05747 [Pestalotiopsis fici W106-1]ETS83871.1 hypothetical protein PFICI_05747 [Pestalotiopsis fici W106-1]